MDLTGSFCTCHFLTDNSLPESADKDQQEMRAVAVAEKPHNAVVNFNRPMHRNVTSRDSPCDSTAIVAFSTLAYKRAP